MDSTIQKKATIHDIARSLGLNSSTVSRALHDHPKISEATKVLVRQKAEELAYHPNQLASQLRTGRSNSIGLVVPRINRSFFANVIFGVEQICSEAGYSLLICQSIEGKKKEMADLEALRNSRVDGLLLSLSVESAGVDHVLSLQKSGIPVVQFDRTSQEVPSHKVANQDREASYRLTRHLVEQGYRRIMHFGGPMYLGSYRQRFEGYRQALEEAGLPLLAPPGEGFVLTYERGYATCKACFQWKNPPDAIFSASDYSAHGALDALLAMGLKVPEEVGVAGYANEPFTALLRPALTSVDLFPIDMGKTAARLLIDTLNGNREGQPFADIRIEPSLCLRDSTLRTGR